MKLLLSLAATLLLSFGAIAQTRGSEEILADLPLSDIEGLWSMTSEDLLVLIIRNGNGRLDMTVAPENIGTGLKSGQLVGYLEPTADTDAYWLYLEDVPKSTRNKLGNVLGTLPFSRRCILRLRGNSDILAIEKGDVNISFNPLSLFPHLNRLIRIRFKNPEANIHEGFRKILPGYDGGRASRSRPVYY